jgi:SAM-dependent methyltransferase
VADLGTAPPSNAYLRESELEKPELFCPLVVRVCKECWLVQADSFHKSDQIFDENYAYFSSFSDTWIEHSRVFTDRMKDELSLTKDSLVIEVASNDGYLLQFFAQQGIPCIGVEPTLSTAAVARSKGLDVITEFFGVDLAKKMSKRGIAANLMISNNVLGHVPDINDFVGGYSILLAEDGVATFEFPHVVNLVDLNQFDTIYHEHFSYLSLTVVADIFGRNGLDVFDVEELSTHGGSLRVFATPTGRSNRAVTSRVTALLELEANRGIRSVDYYQNFGGRVLETKDEFLTFLLNARSRYKKVMAYGAAAKGNTFLNFAGIRSDLLACVADKNPAKVGKFLPGSRIPIVSVSQLMSQRPDYVVILPWNIRIEVAAQLEQIRAWGGKFVVAIPSLEVF